MSEDYMETTTPDKMETPRNENIIKRRRDWDTQQLNFKEEIKQMIKSLKEDMEEKLDKIRQDIKESNNKILSEIMERLTVAEKQNTIYADTINKLDERISQLENGQTKTIQRLEDKIEELLRLKRSKAVEIKNIPIMEGEVIEEPIKKLCEVIGLRDIKISSVHRINSRKKVTSSVIVKFTRVDDKRKFLKHVKSYNLANAGYKITAETLGYEGNRDFIYVNDYLTPHAKNVYFHSRVFAKSNQYKFCWLKDGKVYLKKDVNSKAFHINNINMLDHIESQQ